MYIYQHLITIAQYSELALSLCVCLSLSTLSLIMALRKALTKRQSHAIRVTLAPSSVVLEHQTIVPPNAAQANFHREYLTSTGSADKGFFRRFLHRRALNQSAKLPEFLTIPVGEKLREKLRGINISSDRLRLAGLSPPLPDLATPEDALYGISVSDAKKILKLSQVEKLKAKLREIPESSISYSEFVRICVEGFEDEEQGAEFSKMLDESGNVIVLGNVVFLRPEQVGQLFSRPCHLSFFYKFLFVFLSLRCKITEIVLS